MKHINQTVTKRVVILSENQTKVFEQLKLISKAMVLDIERGKILEVIYDEDLNYQTG